MSRSARWGVAVEGRYRVLPGLYVAARVDSARTSRACIGTIRRDAVPWDAPVTRFEAGGGYYLRRNLVGR